MATEFQYSIAALPNAKYSSSLVDEIRSSSITVALDSVSSSGDTLTISFKADLSAGEVTTLDGIVALHQGIENGSDPIVVRLNGPEDPDKKPIVSISPATVGLKTWFAGAGDGVTVADRGLGNKFQIKFTDAGTSEVIVSFNQPIELHDGQLNWGPQSSWSCDDRFTFSVVLPATEVSSTPGSGDVNEVDLGGGLVMYTPAPGNGSHTLTKAVPVPVKDPLVGYWSCDPEAGIVAPAAAGADFVLLNVEQEAFFITNIGMGNSLGLFDIDVYRTDWIHTTWKVKLRIEKVTAGSGWADGWVLCYRPSNARV